jgi:tetratricopeptide (TPR) repeat protein
LDQPVETVADGLLHEGLELIAGKEDYKTAMEKIDESLQNFGENAEVIVEGELVFSSVILEGLALNIRGTFRFLVGNLVGAMSDFEASIAASQSLDAYIKRASVFMEMGQAERAIEEFELAQAQQDGSGDFYYHRGQVKHLTGDIKGSVGDFRQALELDPSLVYAQVFWMILIR